MASVRELYKHYVVHKKLSCKGLPIISYSAHGRITPIANFDKWSECRKLCEGPGSVLKCGAWQTIELLNEEPQFQCSVYKANSSFVPFEEDERSICAIAKQLFLNPGYSCNVTFSLSEETEVEYKKLDEDDDVVKVCHKACHDHEYCAGWEGYEGGDGLPKYCKIFNAGSADVELGKECLNCYCAVEKKKTVRRRLDRDTSKVVKAECGQVNKFNAKVVNAQTLYSAPMTACDCGDLCHRFPLKCHSWTHAQGKCSLFSGDSVAGETEGGQGFEIIGFNSP